MAKDVTLTIDGLSVTVPEGTLLVEAAKTVQTDVPVYCYHPKLGPAGLCRICLVEVEKMPKLQIACNTAVAEGMVVHTYGAKVEDGRRAVLEFLLLNHPLDCPICDKGGECDLQDYSLAYGQGASRLADPKASKPKAVDLGPTIVLDDERCIVCQRCSRFDEIITRERSLVVKDRGQRDVIATATGEPYRSNFSGNVTELCPVGALTSKTYRFRSRPWDLHRTATTCQQCSVGCALNIDERHGEILRTMSVPDDVPSDGWLCDRGRYNIGFYGDARRVTSPLLRHGDEWVQLSWDDAIGMWAEHLRGAVASAGTQSVAFLGGGRLLNEELVLLATLARSLGVTNLDWRTGRQQHASVPGFGGSHEDLESAQLIVVAGRPPSQTAPVLDLRVRKAVANRGARLVAVGAHAPGAPVPFTARASFDDVSAHDLDGVERVAVVWDGIDPELGRAVAAFLAARAAGGARASAFVPGESPNARGAEALGIVPGDGGRATADVLLAARDGAVRALSIFGANPVLHHPLGAEAVTAALAAVPFVVVSDLFLTETAALAHLVLPAKGPFEKDGHAYDLTGAVRTVRSGHAAPAGPLADGEQLVALAAELDLEVPDPGALRARATNPVPADAGVRFASAPAGNGAGSGLRLAVAADIFAGGGTVRFDDPLAELRPQPSAAFSPATARDAGFAAGDRVDVAANGKTLAGLLVRIDPHAPDGVVAVIDALPGAPANGFADGAAVTVQLAADLATVGGSR